MNLIEQSAVTIITGVLAAISVPNFLGLYNNYKLNNATTNIYWSLVEAQKKAQQHSKKCTLNLPEAPLSDQSVMTSSPADCLVSSYRQLSEGIVLETDLENIIFSFRGLPTETGTIIVSLPKGTNEKRCVEIVDNLGLIQQGIYKNSNCQF